MSNRVVCVTQWRGGGGGAPYAGWVRPRGGRGWDWLDHLLMSLSLDILMTGEERCPVAQGAGRC